MKMKYNKSYLFLLCLCLLSVFLESCDTHISINVNYKMKYYKDPNLALNGLVINKVDDKRFDENSTTDLRYNIGSSLAPVKDGRVLLNVPLPEFVKNSMNTMLKSDGTVKNTFVDIEINSFEVSAKTNPFEEIADFKSEMIFTYKDANGKNVSYKSSITTQKKYDNNNITYSEALELISYEGMVEVEKDFIQYYKQHK
jgi:hypothetical protein